jgi:hypothetical protein
MTRFDPVPGTVFNGGNLAAQNAFDVIFPLQVAPFTDSNYALSSHPVLEAWGDALLTGYGTVQHDDKVFWTSRNENAVLSSAIRAIPTYATASVAGWAASANVTRGITYPTLATQNRVLDTNLSTLPLFPSPAVGLIGSGSPPASGNRAMFNLAFALHSASQTTAGSLNCYLAIRYTFSNQDPTCTIRANVSASDTLVGNPNLLDMPGYMESIAGDDASLIGAGNQRKITHCDTGSDINNPFFTKPTAVFPVLNFTGKIVVQQA